jgi:hypothetical protein
MHKVLSLFIAPKNVGSLPALPLNLDEDNTTRMWVMCGLLLTAFLFVLVPAQLFDPRTLGGAPIWAKPIKFSLSLAVHFFTLALLAQQIGAQYRVNKTLTCFAYAGAASALFELIYISIQAGRGRKSHFNIDTELEITMYNLMGIAAFFLVAVSFVLGVMIWRFSRHRIAQREASNDAKAMDDPNVGLRWGSIIGLIIGSVLTLVFAGYMSSTSSHLVGQPVGQSEVVPVVGWSRTLGDLRIPHFIVTHLIQILPIIGLLSDKLKWRSKWVIALSTIVLVGVSILSFIMALDGRSVFAS